MASRLMNRLRDLTYSPLCGWLVHWPLLAFGAAAFRLSGRTPWLSYWSMRRLYCMSRGRSNHWLARRLAVPRRGKTADEVEARHVDELNRNGYARLGVRLSPQECAELRSFAMSVPARPIPAIEGEGTASFDPSRPGRAVKYDIAEADIVRHPIVRRLIADPTLRALAQSYLGCEPINDLVAMWWSCPGPVSSEAAQLYHFDMDRPQFLKIFFYLTDVDTDTGPHCYIGGSHHDRPAALWRDGRHDDKQVLEGCGVGREVEVRGPEGSAFAVDTSGLHKGKPLVRGNRLVLQIEYTSALFGTVYSHQQVPADDFWLAELAKHPHYYSRFSLRT
jgi:hypothetical protein